MTDEIWAQFSKDPEWGSKEEKAAEFRSRMLDKRSTPKGTMIVKGQALDPTVKTILEALEAFYGNGFADEVSGDVDSPVGHFYRVDRWIVSTDSRGFRDVWNYANIAEAKREFQLLDEEYSKWDGGE
jgi:hypothetical protein